MALTPRSGAVMSAYLYGPPADMDDMDDIAAKHGLPVIEDACQSFGAVYLGRKRCKLLTVGCYGDCHARNPRPRTRKALLPHRRRRPHGHSTQCVIVLAKLHRFDWEVECGKGLGAGYAQYTVFVENREKMLEVFKNAGVPTAVHCPASLHRQPANKTEGPGLAHTARAAARVVSLPVGADLATTGQRRVVVVPNEGIA